MHVQQIKVCVWPLADIFLMVIMVTIAHKFGLGHSGQETGARRVAGWHQAVRNGNHPETCIPTYSTVGAD